WAAQAERLREDARSAGEGGLAAAASSLAQTLAGDASRQELREQARSLERSAAEADDPELRSQGLALAARIGGASGSTLLRTLSWANLRALLPILAGFALVGVAASALLRRSGTRFLLAFPVLFALAGVAFLVAGNRGVNYYGIEYVFWALALGLLISNTVGVPKWLKPGVNTELYIKIGLVLMGGEMLIRTRLTAGALGMLQALAVILAVWYFCYWLAGKLGLDKEFGAILATGVSVCGVSAAIAAGGALKGDPKKVSHTISLVLIMAVPMLILEPIAARALGLSPILAGAWLGGTIDTTGAVVAAGAIAGSEAMNMAVVVKMAQNALIGVVAFLLAMWAALRKRQPSERPNLGEIWFRFPKFVLGFVVTSLVFSLLLSEHTATAITGITKGLRGYWFALAFVSIGLETKVKDLVAMHGGRPALTFVGAQAFNILWTLLIAALVFGGLLFPVPRF
ncbi:MAG: YeiH family protein, partial [Anaerolineae bacterium]